MDGGLPSPPQVESKQTTKSALIFFIGLTCHGSYTVTIVLMEKVAHPIGIVTKPPKLVSSVSALPIWWVIRNFWVEIVAKKRKTRSGICCRFSIDIVAVAATPKLS